MNSNRRFSILHPWILSATIRKDNIGELSARVQTAYELIGRPTRRIANLICSVHHYEKTRRVTHIGNAIALADWLPATEWFQKA